MRIFVSLLPVCVFGIGGGGPPGGKKLSSGRSYITSDDPNEDKSVFFPDMPMKFPGITDSEYVRFEGWCRLLAPAESVACLAELTRLRPVTLRSDSSPEKRFEANEIFQFGLTFVTDWQTKIVATRERNSKGMMIVDSKPLNIIRLIFQKAGSALGKGDNSLKWTKAYWVGYPSSDWPKFIGFVKAVLVLTVIGGSIPGSTVRPANIWEELLKESLVFADGRYRLKTDADPTRAITQAKALNIGDQFNCIEPDDLYAHYSGIMRWLREGANGNMPGLPPSA